MSDPTDMLDQLDEARAKATLAMPLRQDSGWGEDIITADGEQFGATGHPADAALIVAAVNALPGLTAELRKRDAAIRAVAELADSYPLGTDVPVYRLHRILAALTPGADTAGATA